MGESIGDKGLSHAYRAADEHILIPADKLKAKEILELVSVDGDRCIPVEALEGLIEVNPGVLEPGGKIRIISPLDFIVEDEFEELRVREFCPLGIGHPVGECGQEP
jgi:hypothetical protein